MKLTNETNSKDLESASSPARSPALTVLPCTEVNTSPPNTPMRSLNPTPSGHDRLRLPPPPTMPTCVPPLPPAWEGTDKMLDWLSAKMEEDKRRQEEERTRQRTLLLEQRRVEHLMLSDAVRAGVPPNMIPTMFYEFYPFDYNPQFPVDVQTLWSGPGTMIHQQSYSGHAPIQQQPPEQPPQQLHQPPQQPAKIPNSKSKPRSKKKICLPGMDQTPPKAGPTSHEPEKYSDILEAAFKNTLPLVAALEEAARSKFPEGSKEAGDKRKPAQYHYWTPEGAWSSQPQHPTREKQRLQIPASSTSGPSNVAPRRHSERRISGTKRKDQTSHGRVPPPRTRLSDQGPAGNSLAQPKNNHKRRKSDISGSYDSRAYEGDSSEHPLESTPTAPAIQPT